MKNEKIGNATLAVQFEAAFRNAYAGNAHKFFQLSPIALSMLKNAKEEGWKHCQYFLRGCIETRVSKDLVQLTFERLDYKKSNEAFFVKELLTAFHDKSIAGKVLILPYGVNLLVIFNSARTLLENSGYTIIMDDIEYYSEYIKITILSMEDYLENRRTSVLEILG